MGYRQILIILFLDVAIGFAIGRHAVRREGRGLGNFALTGAVALPFALLAAAPFFQLRTIPPVVAARSPVGASDCPPAAKTIPSTGPTVGALRLAESWVVGSVDVAQIRGTEADLCGWAFSVKDRRVADFVWVFAGGRFVAAVRPTLKRPDVARANEGVGARSGFSITLPLGALEHGANKPKVQVFGIERGIASSLPFNCAHVPHDLGC